MLVPTSALLWGMQSSFLVPTLALILTSLYDASTTQIGWALAIYNTSGFISALVIPSWADRRREYLYPMLCCAGLTLLLIIALGSVTSLPPAIVALVAFGGPAGVGVTMLYAHLRNAGEPPTTIVNTRAIVSASWVVGPPVATMLIGTFGHRSILIAIGAISLMSGAVAALLIRQREAPREQPTTASLPGERPDFRKGIIAIVALAFVFLYAGSNAEITIIALYTNQTLGLSVQWAGAAMSVGAAIEVVLLVLVGKLNSRFSSLALVISGCVAGIAGSIAMALIPANPVALIAVQVIKAWRVATVTGMGITLFQQMIPRPGFATGLFMNTVRMGAVTAGPIIALGSLSPWGQRGIYCISALLAALGLIALIVVARTQPPHQSLRTEPIA